MPFLKRPQSTTSRGQTQKNPTLNGSSWWRSFTSALLAGTLLAACGTSVVPTAQLTDTNDPAADGHDAERSALKRQLAEKYLELDQAAGQNSELEALPVSQLRAVLSETANNPVARLDKVPFYDPDSLTGFCFGRSMTAQLVARKAGLRGESIKNLFIVGDLKQRGAEKTEWRFHVTTVALGDDGVWYALDPIFGFRTMSEWIATTRELWDSWHLDDENTTGPQSKLYLVGRHAVLPDIRDFKTPENETGELLIDLSFTPDRHEGFQPRADLGARVWELDDDTMNQYFISGAEEPGESFDFVELVTHFGLTISYNNYFADLFESLVALPAPGPTEPAGELPLPAFGTSVSAGFAPQMVIVPRFLGQKALTEGKVAAAARAGQ